MKTIHLHIGLPKTATTLIQNTMFACPEILRKYGIQYLQSGTDKFGDRGHHILVVGNLGKRGQAIRPRTTPEEIEEAWPLALAEIDASDNKHFFISSELFSFGVIDPDDITNIRTTLKGYKVNVILVLRDVADFVDSVYAQRLKGGFDGSVEEFVARNWDNLHWRNMTQKWSRIFGRSNVKVLDFNALKAGNLVDNFVQRVFGLTFDAETFPRETMNPALPYYAAEIVREVNASQIATKQKIAFRIHMRDFFNTHGSEGTFRKAKFLSPDSSTILRHYCQWPAVDK